MVKKLIFSLTGALFAAMALAAGTLTSEVLNRQAPDRYTVWDFMLSEQGKFWFAYYGADNKLYVRRPGGDEIGLSAADRPHQQSGLAIDRSGENGLALFWRDKLPDKTLFLIPELDATGAAPPPVVVGGEESAPLPGLKIAQDNNETYLLWLGEKVDPKTSEKYHLYFRAVEADGKTLSPVEQVLPGLYPAWIVDEKAIPVFSWVDRPGQPAISMRVFDRAKKSFGSPIEIARVPAVASLLEAFRSGNRWFVVWLGMYENQLLFEGAWSDDQGQNWKRFAFEDLRGFNQGGIDIATDHQGHILIALDGNWRFTKPDDTKNNVYVLRSDDNGATWQKPRTVRAEEHRLTRGQYPMIAMGSAPGTVMLAWEDWRDIRSNVYVSYSRDYGATWEPALPLGRPGIWNLGLNPQARVLLSGPDGRFRLVAKQLHSTTAQGGYDLVLYTFNWEELQKSAASFAPTPDTAAEEHLRERLAAYWEAMKNRQYDVSYAFMDPFFRDVRSLVDYQSTMGIVQYHSYEIGEIIRKGNIAKVRIKLESSVPEFTTPSGKKVSQPRKPISFFDTWLFVNNDWYREHYDGITETSVTRY